MLRRANWRHTRGAAVKAQAEVARLKAAMAVETETHADETRELVVQAQAAAVKAKPTTLSWYLGLLIFLASFHLVYCGLLSISMATCQYSTNDLTNFPSQLNILTASAQPHFVLGMSAATVLVLGQALASLKHAAEKDELAAAAAMEVQAEVAELTVPMVSTAVLQNANDTQDSPGLVAKKGVVAVKQRWKIRLRSHGRADNEKHQVDQLSAVVAATERESASLASLSELEVQHPC